MKYIILFLVLTPLATALDCSSTSSPVTCQEIQNSKLNQTEKDYLLADIMSKTKNYPDHLFVKDWNKEQKPTSPANKKNSNYIREAWVKIFAVMPSVLLDDELLIPEKTEVIAGGNYRVNVPQNTASGDCKTRRSITTNKDNLQIQKTM